MKALLLVAPGRVDKAVLKEPAGGADYVLVKVTHSAICGTDVKIFNGIIPVEYPRVMGHEMGGEVTGASGLTERVLIDPMICCGNCFHCRAGLTNLCPHGKLLGRDADGGFADYVQVPVRNIHPLPDSIASEAVPILQVLATCIHAQRLVPFSVGGSVAVIGLGVTGQLHAQLARCRGASLVVGNSRSAFRRELARQHGVVVVSNFDDLVVSALDATSGRGVDVVIETTGEPAAMEKAVAMCRAGGHILLFGINSSTSVDLSFYQLYYKELAVVSARSAKSEDFSAAIGVAQRGLVTLEPLITHRFRLDQLLTALQEMQRGGGERLKIVLAH